MRIFSFVIFLCLFSIPVNVYSEDAKPVECHPAECHGDGHPDVVTIIRKYAVHDSETGEYIKQVDKEPVEINVKELEKELKREISFEEWDEFDRCGFISIFGRYDIYTGII